MRRRLATIALSATIGLLAHAPAQAAVDRLFKRDLDTAAADIVWGNRAKPDHARQVLAIDPPLERLGPAKPVVEVLEFYRYDNDRSRRGPRLEWAENASELAERWRGSLPNTVNVIRVPIAVHARARGGWRWNWEFAARTHLHMLLIGRALGIEEEVHESLLTALDADPDAFRFPVYTGVAVTPESVADLRDRARSHFQTKLGIEPARFDEAWDSDEITNQMDTSISAHQTVRRASDQRARRSVIDPRPIPPILLINGKHIVAGYNIRKRRQVFELANEFIARELAAPEPTTGSAEEERWRTLYEELRSVRPHDTLYEDPQAPEPSQVIELDPPLPTDAGPNALEIEIFFSYLHRGYDAALTTSWLTGRIERLMVLWIDTAPASTFARLRARFTPVTEIPGHPGTTKEHARMLQELVLGHGYTTTAEPGERRPTHVSFPIHRAVRQQFRYYVPPERLDQPREVKQLLRWAKLYTREYRKVARSNEPALRADEANRRFATVLARAERAAPDAFRAPAYPIVLIDGRYLVTGALAGSYTNAARIVNHVIRQQIAKRGW